MNSVSADYSLCPVGEYATLSLFITISLQFMDCQGLLTELNGHKFLTVTVQRHKSRGQQQICVVTTFTERLCLSEQMEIETIIQDIRKVQIYAAEL